MVSVVIDASVALKWVIDEAFSSDARALLDQHSLMAPDLFWVDCAKVLWVKVRRGALALEDARAAWAMLDTAAVMPVPTRSLAGHAVLIAFEIDETPYDSLYLAAAVSERAVLFTADERLAAAAKKHPVYANHVRLLGAV